MFVRWNNRKTGVLGVALLAVAAFCGGAARGDESQAATEPAQAAEILKASGVRGGLVVHLGCGDGLLTAALRASDSYLVHGLDAEPANVGQARQYVASRGLYGPVSVDRVNGSRLPYIDNAVNLLVVSGPSSVDREEIVRVLCPGGVAVFTADHGPLINDKLVKPWPADIDQWTHHLHDSGGNAVARDTVVGPPQHLQWTAGPLWSRSHGWTPSVSAMVSASGRLFYLCDETLTCVDGTVPDQWFLIARDAFSGVLLWKRPVQPWGSQALSGTPGTGAGSTTGRFTMPPNIGKRLVAVGDTVYVTLGAKAPVTALDAATGRERRVYAETAGADEILCADGRLIVDTQSHRSARRQRAGQEQPASPRARQACLRDRRGKRHAAVEPGSLHRHPRDKDPGSFRSLGTGRRRRPCFCADASSHPGVVGKHGRNSLAHRSARACRTTLTSGWDLPGSSSFC